jgi:hypothetical protein
MHISKNRLKIMFILNFRTSKGNGCLKSDFFTKTTNKIIFSAVAVLKCFLTNIQIGILKTDF